MDYPKSDQLDLWALETYATSREPWSGRSPRALTRGYEFRIFKAQAEKSVSDFVSDENQLDLWLAIKKAPAVPAGAPLLLEPRRL